MGGTGVAENSPLKNSPHCQFPRSNSPLLSSPRSIPPRLISPWRVRVRVSVRVRIHQGEIKQGRVGRGRRHQGVFDRGEQAGRNSPGGNSPRSGKWGLDRQFFCANLGNFSEQIWMVTSDQTSALSNFPVLNSNSCFKEFQL